MKLWVKIGTHAAGIYDFPRRRKPPKVGDSVKWVEMKGGKPQTGIVDDIREVGGLMLYFMLYFIERF